MVLGGGLSPPPPPLWFFIIQQTPCPRTISLVIRGVHPPPPNGRGRGVTECGARGCGQGLRAWRGGGGGRPWSPTAKALAGGGLIPSQAPGRTDRVPRIRDWPIPRRWPTRGGASGKYYKRGGAGTCLSGGGGGGGGGSRGRGEGVQGSPPHWNENSSKSLGGGGLGRKKLCTKNGPTRVCQRKVSLFQLFMKPALEMGLQFPGVTLPEVVPVISNMNARSASQARNACAVILLFPALESLRFDTAMGLRGGGSRGYPPLLLRCRAVLMHPSRGGGGGCREGVVSPGWGGGG